MSRVVAAALALAALTGCVKPVPPPAYVPPLLVCDSRCRAECDSTVPAWAPPNVNDPAAFDFIRPQVVDPLEAKLLRCEEHRRACVACLDEADRQGIIVSQDP